VVGSLRELEIGRDDAITGAVATWYAEPAPDA
jgi:hypothetical protein